MEMIMTIFLFVFIGVTGYIFVERAGTFFDENEQTINEQTRTKLIYIGFDRPCLVDNFLSRVNGIDNQHNSVEVMIYSGTADEIQKKLEEGAIDYAVLSELNFEKDKDQMHEKEMSLKPEKLRTDISNTRIDMVKCECVKVSVLWIPDRIVKEKTFFTNLILQL